MAALAAWGIVARRCCLVNCHALGILVRDLVEFFAIEGNPLFSNADFPQKRAYFLVEHAAAHRQVRRRFADSDESGSNIGHLSDPHELDYPHPRVDAPLAGAVDLFPQRTEHDARQRFALRRCR